MRIVFSGDWQASINNLDRCELIVQQICELLRERQAEASYFVHLGDVKDAFNPVDVRVTNFLIRAFDAIRTASRGFYFVRGNHDSITTQDGVPSCAPLLQALDANAIADTDAYRVMLGRGLGVGPGVSLSLVPYFRNPKTQRLAFQTARNTVNLIKDGAYKILVFHNEVTGCERTAYTKGDAYTLDEIDAKGYDLCVGGHIHRPQQMGNVWFAGSPFPQDWGECNEDKSLLIFDYKERPHKMGTPKIWRVPSCVPNWYDPNTPGYSKPSSWKGTHVRISVPILTDAVREMQAAHTKLETKYPGAVLHLQPEYQKDAAPAKPLDIKTESDEGLLVEYLSKAVLPPNVTIDQTVAYLKTFLPALQLFGVQGLTFQTCTARNVLCFESVELELDREGITLITGQNKDWGDTISNGAGKSSLVALPFIVLFGKTFKNQTHDAWARQSTEKTALGTLTVKLPNGDILRVERSRRPGLLRCFRNGLEISMGDANASQTQIEALTNLTWSVLTNAVYIGQREIGSVFGTEKERKELFSRLLGLDRFLAVQEKLRQPLQQSRRAVEDAEQEIRTTESALNEAQSNLRTMQEALEGTPPVDLKHLEGLDKRLAFLSEAVERRNKLCETLSPQFVENQKRFDVWLTRAIQVQTEIEGLEKQRESCSKVEGGTACPICGSKVTIASLEKHVKEIKKVIAQKTETLEKYERNQKLNRAARKLLFDEEQKHQRANKTDNDEFQKLRNELTRLQTQAAARKQVEEFLKVKQTRVEILTRNKGLLKAAKVACAEELQFLEFCNKTVGRDGLPAYLAAVVAPQLNQAALRYSETFSNNEINVRFEIDSGEIDVEICNLHGGSEIKDQSAGEMRMAGIIAAFAFRDVLVPHNILILDEPGEGLDATNAAAFARGLNKVKDRFKHIMVISHNTNVLAGLEPDFQLIVTKRDGVAVVESV